MTEKRAISMGIFWAEKFGRYRIRIQRYWGGFIYGRYIYLPSGLNPYFDKPLKLLGLILFLVAFLVSLVILFVMGR